MRAGRAETKVIRRANRPRSSLTSGSPCVRASPMMLAPHRQLGLAHWACRAQSDCPRHGRTSAGSEVELPGLVKPSGVIAEIKVDPARNELNSVRAWSDPPTRVTGEATAPTPGSLLCRTTFTETPARSGCTVMSAPLFVTGSSCIIQTTRGIVLPPDRLVTKPRALSAPPPARVTSASSGGP